MGVGRRAQVGQCARGEGEGGAAAHVGVNVSSDSTERLAAERPSPHWKRVDGFAAESPPVAVVGV